MAKSVTYLTGSGAILATYDDVDSPVPGSLPGGVASLAISDTVWLAFLQAPGTYSVGGGALVQNSGAVLLRAQTQQVGTLNTAAVAAITGGFTSSALGSVHTYPSDMPAAQTNLTAAATASLAPGLSGGWTTPLWTETGGVWSFINHSAAQVQQVLVDFLSYRSTQQIHLNTLTASVYAATTTAQVAAITW